MQNNIKSNIKFNIQKLSNGESLQFIEAKEMFHTFLEGEVSSIEMASVLTALKIKGETADELAGAAAALRARTTQSRFTKPVIDTCGTGGDGSGSFNISTATAFVVAGAGIYVAKHGNRSVTSRSGSADVLEALGVHIEMTEKQAMDCLENTGIGFFYAPAIHKSMKEVMPVRRALRIRTVFNLIGPLCNPVKLSGQLIGVGDLTKLNTMAEAACILGLQRTMLVCSDKGVDELTLSGTNRAILVENGKKTEIEIKAGAFELIEASDEDLKGGTAQDNARIMESVLKNERTPYRDAVLLNAGAAIYVSGEAQDLETGIEMAKISIAQGHAEEKLRLLKAKSLSFKKEKIEQKSVTVQSRLAINRMVGL